MNFYEIESILKSLIERHPNLDETMLRTLLASSGWDEKIISEAVSIYRNRKDIFTLEKDEGKFLPKVEEENLLSNPISNDSLLLSHNQTIEVEKEELSKLEKTQSSTQESTITTQVKARNAQQEIDLPQDLPLQPFENTQQAWPFSRYKEVFHGSVMPTSVLEAAKPKEKSVKARSYFSRTPMSEKEVRLVIFASTMLLVVLLLLGYMYSNGRL